MGCHTWFYKKLDNQPDYEDIRLEMLEFYKTEIGYYERHISNTLSDDEKWLFEDKSIEDSIHALNVLKRHYRLIEGRYCKVATLSKYPGFTNRGLDFSRVNGQFYVGIDNYHDAFRIGNYPEDELFSLQETLDFIEKHKDEIRYNDDWKKEIEEFWTKYPNGRITFG